MLWKYMYHDMNHVYNFMHVNNNFQNSNSSNILWTHILYLFIGSLGLFKEAMLFVGDGCVGLGELWPLLPQTGPHVGFLQKWVQFTQTVQGLLQNQWSLQRLHKILFIVYIQIYRKVKYSAMALMNIQFNKIFIFLICIQIY